MTEQTIRVVEQADYKNRWHPASPEDSALIRQLNLFDRSGNVYREVAEALGTEFTVAQAEALIAEWARIRAERKAAVTLVKCSCGHTIPSAQVMSTSRGTSCLDCYDRMSL